MPLFSNGHSFPLGETIQGTMDGNIVNRELEGAEAVITFEQGLGGGPELFEERVRHPAVVRIIRNTSGGALLPGEIATLDIEEGVSGLGHADAKSSANDKHVVIVDPTLPAAGVADDDLFIGFVKGPTKIKFPSGGLTLTGGNLLRAGASGRAALAETGAGTSRNVIATALSGAEADSANQNALRPVLLHPIYA